jgi:mannose-1-phosphate guanylyltransferase
MTEVYGVDVPKQYCTFKGDQSLLRMALRRAAMLTSRERVVPVVSDQHRQWWEPQLADVPRDNIVVQPCNRGTACGVLLPLIHVLLKEPRASVVILPSDHFVRQEAVFARTATKAFKIVRDAENSIVLLGIRPDGPDSDFGWIEPTLGALDGVHWVLSFVEKPLPVAAQRLMEQGCLWNSCVLVARGVALLSAFKRAFPELVERFGAACVSSTAGEGEERLSRLYARLPSLDLSRDLLQPNDDDLRVLPVPPCGWSDLGTPERVARCLENEGIPPHLDHVGTGGEAPFPDLATAVARSAHRRTDGPPS